MSCIVRRSLLLTSTIFIPFALHKSSDDSNKSNNAPTHPDSIQEFQSSRNLSLEKLIILARHGHRTGRIRLASMVEHADNASLQEVDYWNCLPLYQHVGSYGQSKQGDSDSGDSSEDGVQFEVFYENTPDGNCLKGSLTQQGALQMKTLGKQMHHYYGPFLNTHTRSLADLYCRSSDVVTRRTEESLKYFLSGFLGENHPLRHHRVPIALRHSALETMYPMFERCQQLNNLAIKQTNPEWMKEEAQRHTGVWDLIKRINTSSNMSLLFPLSVLNTLRSYSALGYDLPKPFTAEQMEQLENFCAEYSHQLFGESVAIQLSIGRFLDEILDSLHGSAMKNQNNDREQSTTASQASCNIFLGHDTTILPLAAAFTRQARIHPHFASNLIFELYTDNRNPSQKFVRLLLDGEAVEIPTLEHPSQFEAGDCLYRYEDFRRYAQQFSITQEEYYNLCRGENIV